MTVIMTAIQSPGSNRSLPFVYGRQGSTNNGSNIPLMLNTFTTFVGYSIEISVIGTQAYQGLGATNNFGCSVMKTAPVGIWQNILTLGDYRLRSTGGANVAFNSGNSYALINNDYFNDLQNANTANIWLSNNGGGNIVMFMSNAGTVNYEISWTAEVKIISCCPTV
jgi:hypothetical protein